MKGMWRRIRNHEFAEPLPQRNGAQPTSGQALELALTSDVRQNVVRHLSDEQRGSAEEGAFRAALGESADFRLPGIQGIASSDVSWSYLPTVFVVNVTEEDEGIEVAYIPDEMRNDVNLFLPLLLDNRRMELWIDLRGYWGEQSFITDAFVRPYRFSVEVVRGSWNATVRFVHRTRRQAGTLVGRVLVKMGEPDPNLLTDDVTMSARLERSESAYGQQALLVPRLEASTVAKPGDVCAVWVHGTASCALEGIKDLPALPQIPMYRFEHDTFHEIGENADNLATLINQLGYSRTHILAHSRGGLVARFCQQIVSNRYGKQCRVVTFGTPHLGTPMADAAAGGLALLMRAGDFIVDGIPYASYARRIAGMFVGVDLPAGVKAMQPSSEVLRSYASLLHQPFESWAGVYRDTGGTTSYGTDIGNIASGMFGDNTEHDLVVPTQSSLGGNTAMRLETSHFDYFKQAAVQSFIAQLK
jgi:hypothetical protein